MLTGQFLLTKILKNDRYIMSQGDFALVDGQLSPRFGIVL